MQMPPCFSLCAGEGWEEMKLHKCFKLKFLVNFWRDLNG